MCPGVRAAGQGKPLRLQLWLVNTSCWAGRLDASGPRAPALPFLRGSEKSVFVWCAHTSPGGRRAKVPHRHFYVTRSHFLSKGTGQSNGGSESPISEGPWLVLTSEGRLVWHPYRKVVGTGGQAGRAGSPSQKSGGSGRARGLGEHSGSSPKRVLMASCLHTDVPPRGLQHLYSFFPSSAPEAGAPRTLTSGPRGGDPQTPRPDITMKLSPLLCSWRTPCLECARLQSGTVTLSRPQGPHPKKGSLIFSS